MRIFGVGRIAWMFLLTATFTIACAEPPSGTGAARPGDVQAPSFAKPGNQQAGSMIVRIDPKVGASISFGNNFVRFGDNVVCEPESSGYGVETWDLACSPATEPFDLKIDWKTKDGHTIAEFTPDLRFVPSDDMRYWAYLTLYERKVDVTKYFNIFWRGADGKWVDEYKTDPTLKPWTNQQRNEITRRIRHFSGYMSGVGFAEEFEESGY